MGVGVGGHLRLPVGLGCMRNTAGALEMPQSPQVRARTAAPPVATITHAARPCARADAVPPHECAAPPHTHTCVRHASELMTLNCHGASTSGSLPALHVGGRGSGDGLAQVKKRSHSMMMSNEAARDRRRWKLDGTASPPRNDRRPGSGTHQYHGLGSSGDGHSLRMRQRGRGRRGGCATAQRERRDC